MIWQNYFPHKPRFGQDKICDFVSNAVSNRKIAVVEAPYGIGKTASMLASGLASGKKVIFATCDHAVQDAIVHEVLNINKKLSEEFGEKPGEKLDGEKPSKKLVVSALIGKGHMCPHLHYFNYEACDFEKLHKRCPFFNHTYKKARISKGISEKTEGLIAEIIGIMKNKPESFMKNDLKNKNKSFADFIIDKCVAEGLCPYEFMLELSARADVVILDYFHVFTPILGFMRKRVFNPENSVLFVDEADRLRNRLLDILTYEISDKGLNYLKTQIKKAMKKTRPKTLDDFGESDDDGNALEEGEKGKKDKNISHAEWLFYLRFVETFEEFILEKEKSEPALNKKFSNEDGVYIDITKQEFIDFLESRLYDFAEIIDKISSIVEKLADSESSPKRVSQINEFLKLWENLPDDYFTYVLLNSASDKKSVVASPYELAGAPLIVDENSSQCFFDILKNFYSSILFSATIGNIDVFAELLGIKDFTSLASKEFNTENYMVILKKDISSVYKERQMNVGRVVHDLTFFKELDRNILISFPSYACSSSILHYLNAKPIQDAGAGAGSGKGAGTDTGSGKGIYYVITGGKGSRGINKAAGLDIAYIYGLQLAKPDDYLFNKRRDFAIKKYGSEKALKLIYNDVVNKSCQTAGRIFRDAGKKGLVVLADKRYKYDFRLNNFFFECIPSYFKIKMIETIGQGVFEQAVKKFWQAV